MTLNMDEWAVKDFEKVNYFPLLVINPCLTFDFGEYLC
jgi:hypothetical protein